jgi:nickel-dependent lactate racemase
MPDGSSGLRVRFGTVEHDLRVPRGELAARIEPLPVRAAASGEAMVRRALDAPLGSPRLREMARGKRSAAILVPGQDRVAGARLWLPLLLEELSAAGVPEAGIEVILATGTHAKHSPEEAARLLGAEVAARVRWREHRAAEAAGLARVGVTPRGNAVSFDRAALEADVRVLTGRIIPHYFAGFGGGRKALLPGIAGFETIRANHRLTLAPERGIHPQVRACSLAGNPVHLDMLDAARMAGPAFVLNTLLDADHEVIGAFAGGLEAAHEAGCAEAERIFKVTLAEPLDAVVASAGGAPYDCNFMQALKAAFDVQEAVRPGGALLWIARCQGGMHEGFGRWARIADDAELDRAVRAAYDLTGHNSILLRQLVRRLRVALWSELPDDAVTALGVQPVHSLSQGLAWLLEACPGRFRYGVAPHANVTYATLA